MAKGTSAVFLMIVGCCVVTHTLKSAGRRRLARAV